MTTQSIADVDMTTSSTFSIETRSTESTACLDCPLKDASQLESDPKNPIGMTIPFFILKYKI